MGSRTSVGMAFGLLIVVVSTKADDSLLEEAQVQIAAAGKESSPEIAAVKLARAEKLLREFLDESLPAAQAKAASRALTETLSDEGERAVERAKLAARKSERDKRQTDARRFFAEARRRRQAESDAAKTLYETFPKFIDKEDDPERYAERLAAEKAYIEAQYRAAEAGFKGASAWDRESTEFARGMSQAAAEFEEMHKRYRSQVGGLYARLHQGRCFQELGDLRKALGIYNEMLAHEGQSPTMKSLQHQARWFRLIALNDEQLKDYQLVIQESSDWLKDNPDDRESRVAAGILQERQRAMDAMKQQRTAPRKSVD